MLQHGEGVKSLPKLINEKELRKAIRITRHTVYYWRLQGIPVVLTDGSVYRYLYDLKAVKVWAKEHNKRY